MELGSCAAGAVLGLWEWCRLRRAKAARPDLSWREYLGTDLIGLGIVAVLLVFAAMPPEQRDELVRSLQELADLASIARGRP